jgi:hypothetical protein
MLQVLLALFVLNRIQGINWTCTQHMHCSVTWKTYDCAVECLVLWQAEKYLEKWIWRLLNRTSKIMSASMWRCASSELWCSVIGQEVPAIQKQAVKKSFLDWLHLKVKDATITHNIGHHSCSDKVSTSQKTWVLKSTTVRSSNFTFYWKPFVPYLIPSFYRTKLIIWCT